VGVVVWRLHLNLKARNTSFAKTHPKPTATRSGWAQALEARAGKTTVLLGKVAFMTNRTNSQTLFDGTIGPT
jgi:hypothetical protein